MISVKSIVKMQGSNDKEWEKVEKKTKNKRNRN